MTTAKNTIARLEAIHQLPESHPIAQRERISLAHVDFGAGLRRSSAAFAKNQTRGQAKNAAAACEFAIGQTVWAACKEGVIVAIVDGKISIEIAGSVRVFAASLVDA